MKNASDLRMCRGYKSWLHAKEHRREIDKAEEAQKLKIHSIKTSDLWCNINNITHKKWL